MGWESTALKIVIGVLSLAQLVIVWYLWYLILKHTAATEFMWFIFAFMIFFGVIVFAFRGAVEDIRLKDLQKRVKALEERKY